MKIFTLRHSWPVILEAKRRESILLAMALVFAVFTACDSSSSSADPDPIAEVSSSSGEVSKNSSSSQKSADKEKSSSSEKNAKESSSSAATVKNSSSSAGDNKSSSSVKKEDSSSSAVKSSSSVTPKSSSSEEVKQSSSSVVASSSSVAVQSSSSSYDRTDAFKGTLWRKGEYKTFVDTRDNREYYYIEIAGEDTAGNVATIKVMAENLNVGEFIRGRKNQEDDSKIERYCYDNDTTNCNKYGGLYQWAEMMQLPSRCNTESCADLIKPNHQGICPSGWRLLTYNDYYIVVHADNNEDGVKGTRAGRFGGSNDSGYSLIGAGGRTDEGRFVSLNDATFWYYPREILSEGFFLPNAGYTSAYRNTMDGKDNCNYTKREGYSVRCVMVE